ncbi:MAG TPA: LiaF domain-containing protein [Planctomycetota bacterium]
MSLSAGTPVLKDSFRFRLPSLVLGLLALAAGALMLAEADGDPEAAEVLRYWPAGLVLFGLSLFASARRAPGRGFGFVLMVAGVVILLRALEWIYVDPKVLWPIPLIAFGLLLVLRFVVPLFSFRRKPADRGVPGKAGGTSLHSVAFLSGDERRINARDFRGGKLLAVMGGVDLDFTEADIEGDQAVLSLLAVMGGIDIKIPRNWEVVLHGVPILGVIIDKTKPDRSAPTKKLVIKGLALMGGVEVKN